MAWDPDDDAILRAGRWTTGTEQGVATPPPESDLEPVAPASFGPEPPPAPPDRARGRHTRTIAIVTALVLVAGLAGFATTMVVLDARDKPSADAASDGQVLDGLIVQQSDLGPDNAVVALRDGSDAVNTPTLDLCNGNYPSEGSRIARRQVAVAGLEGTSKFGTEAVTYRDTATSARAFEEVQRVAATCPKTPVPNASGTATYTTLFNPPPDGAWKDAPSVDRLAYDITQRYTDDTSQRSIVVYLRRGRVLMGLYFPQPDAPPSVRGKTDVAGIVTVFAERLAALPPAAVADPPD